MTGPARTWAPVGAGTLGVLAGLVLASVLAGAAGPESSAWPGGLALGAACLLLGLGALGYVDAEPSRVLIAATAGFWGAASLIAAWLQLAERSGTSPAALRVDDLVIGVESGLGLLVCVAGAVVVLAWTFRPFAPEILVAVVAATGVLAIATTGHAATGAWAPLLVGAHALAAAWWAGTLAALALTVRGRGGWARSLPEFSRYAVVAVAVLTATGVLAALGELGLSAEWVQTGYGRVVVAKAVVLAVLLTLAARHRRTWVPGAARHRTPEDVSLRRAVIETLLLAVALGLAAGLATTAPGVG